MANRDRIGARHFFGGGTIWGFLIGLFITLMLLFIYNETNPVSRNQRALEFKKYLFHAVVSKLGELNEEPDAENVNFVIATANFLKSEFKKGNTIEGIVKEETKLSAIYNISHEDERERVATLFLPEVPTHIILLAQNREWKRFRDNPENIRVLKELLAGNGKIPEIVYPDDNNWLNFWIAIFIIQLSTFIGYIGRVGENRYQGYGFPKFYQLQWNKFGTYIVILLLSPGMWIIVTPWFLWRLFSFDCSEFFSERREAKLVKKNEARKAVMLQEARVEKLRKSVASIAATGQVAHEESQEDILFVEKFKRTKIKALENGDEEIAQEAAMGELEALKRADMQMKYSEHCVEEAKYLERQLVLQEKNLLLMRDKKSTIELRTQVTEGMNNLYQLLADVESETGVATPRLILEEELRKSRHEELTSSNLITLMEKRKRLQGAELPQHVTVSIEQIQGEINLLQKRIALPEKAGDTVN